MHGKRFPNSDLECTSRAKDIIWYFYYSDVSHWSKSWDLNTTNEIFCSVSRQDVYLVETKKGTVVQFAICALSCEIYIEPEWWDSFGYITWQRREIFTLISDPESESCVHRETMKFVGQPRTVNSARQRRKPNASSTPNNLTSKQYSYHYFKFNSSLLFWR